MPDELIELKVFAAVAEQLSFRRAARQLNTPPSAVSRTIRQLEQRVGTTLFNRTTRSVSLTAAGRALAERSLPALATLRRAVTSLDSTAADPAGEVRINLALLAALDIFVPRMGQFADLHPRVGIEFFVVDEAVDIVAQGCDAGVRPQSIVPMDMISIQLTAPIRMAIVGAPRYLATHPAPRTPADLAVHRCVGYRWGTDRAPFRWQLHDGDRTIDATPDAQFTVTNVDLMVRMAEAGAGLTLTLTPHVEAQIAAGTLRSVLADYCPVLPPLCLYYPAGQSPSPALRAVIDFFRYRETIDDTGC